MDFTGLVLEEEFILYRKQGWQQMLANKRLTEKMGDYYEKIKQKMVVCHIGNNGGKHGGCVRMRRDRGAGICC